MKNKLFWLFLFITYSTFGQHSVKGIVTSTKTNHPLEFVNVYFPEIEKGTITDENGIFKISNLPSGNFKILVSYLGFQTISKRIQIPLDTELTIGLSPVILQIDEIILSTPFHKLQGDNVMKVEHKKVSELNKIGAINLSNGMTSIPGVESVSTGVSIGKPVIRGLSNNRVLVYTQGIRLENQQFGDEHGLGISSSGIESIEVIKGPASLLYGSDALGGVLYINPEKFANTNTKNADFGIDYFTNTKGYNTNLGYKSSTEKFKVIFRGNLSEHADYKTKDYYVTNSRFKEQDFKSALGYQSTYFTTEFRYNLNASQIGIPEEISIQNRDTKPLLPLQKLNNHIFSSKSKLFLENSSLELNLGYTYNDRKEFEEHHHDHEHEEDVEVDDDEILEPALHMKLQTLHYDLKYNLPQFGKIVSIVGFQGMSQTNTNYGEEYLIPDSNTTDLGILATSHIHFENYDLQLGARFDTRKIDTDEGLNKTFNSFNGAVGIKKDISKKVTLRLNLASGFRAPNLAELTSEGSHEGTNRYEIGNPDLKSEQNYQVDINVEYQSEHLEVFANGFYNSIANYIFLSPDGNVIDNNPVYLYQQEDAYLFGGEFGFHIHPHPLDWLHIENTFETVIGKQKNDKYLPLIPANKLTNTARAEFESNSFKNAYCFISLGTTFKQNNISEFESNTNGYSLFSAGFGSEFNFLKKKLSISVSGNNLTNKTYINHLSRLKVDDINNIGRNINLGLHYTF